MTDPCCHECRRVIPCRSSPAGRPTCADCWPGLRADDRLGYGYCGDCALRLDVVPDVETVIRFPHHDDRCDRCGANEGRALR